MKVVVTGGSGLVGKNLQDVVSQSSISNSDNTFVFLNRSKNDEYSLDCENRDAVMAYFEKQRFDAIIHLAACVGGLFMHIDNNEYVYEKNKRINDNVLDACHLTKIKYGVFCSSSCVFPHEPEHFPMDEEMMCAGDPHPTNCGYANAKREMYERCREMNERHGYNYVCLIPVNMYGKFDNFDLNNGHFIPALMHRFELTKKAVRDGCAFSSYSDLPTQSPCEEKYVAYGDGTPLRQLLYAKDFADIIRRVLTSVVSGIYGKPDPMVVCSDEEYAISEVVRKLTMTMGIEYDKVVWDTSKANGCMKKTVTNCRFKRAFPEYRFTSLLDGLRETYEWFEVTNLTNHT